MWDVSWGTKFFRTKIPDNIKTLLFTDDIRNFFTPSSDY